jgi:hypothetical protein
MPPHIHVIEAACSKTALTIGSRTAAISGIEQVRRIMVQQHLDLVGSGPGI